MDIALSTPVSQTGRLPVVVGGHGPRTLDTAAKHARRWNRYGTRSRAGDVFDALRRTSDQLSERCQVIERDPAEVTRSVLLDLNSQLSPSTASELTNVVGRLHEIGFEECISYAWLDGVASRNTDELLSFVVNDLPSLRGRPG